MMSPIKPLTHQILDLSRAHDWVKYSDESKSRRSFIGDKLTHSFFKSRYMMPEVRLGQIAPNHQLPTGILLLLLLSTRPNLGESPGNMLGIPQTKRFLSDRWPSLDTPWGHTRRTSSMCSRPI